MVSYKDDLSNRLLYQGPLPGFQHIACVQYSIQYRAKVASYYTQDEAMGGKKKRGAKAKAPPKDYSDMLNPPESKEDYVEELEDLELSDDKTDQALVTHQPPAQEEEIATPVAASLQVSAITHYKHCCYISTGTIIISTHHNS